MTSHEGSNSKAIFAWALYDFANSSYSTLVLTFIYSTYFANAVAPDEISGTSTWSLGLFISGLTVALCAPVAGAFADAGGLRKRFLFFLTLLAVVMTASLYTVVPGQVVRGILLFVIANVAVEMGMVFYNAYLPDIAPLSRIGRISGYGWAFGYVGGLLAMLVAMVGFVEAETPWFGFTKANNEHIRATNLLVAAWFALFSLPIFYWVREKDRPRAPGGTLLASTFRQLRDTLKEIRTYRQIIRLLVARLFYNDGLLTVFSFGGIYARGTFGFTFEEIMIFGIVLNITAGLGAYVLGFLDDRIGGKRTLQISIIAFMLATALAVIAGNKQIFWIAGIIIGIFSGPTQAASRSLMGRFIPADKEGEFFGFYAFSGKATAFVGPLLLGLVTSLTNSQRAGIATVIFFFLAGILLLNRVDEREGCEAAARIKN